MFFTPLFSLTVIELHVFVIILDESSSFMRKDSAEAIENYWVDVRQTLTQDYKKKRKDALRRQKKLAHRK